MKAILSIIAVICVGAASFFVGSESTERTSQETKNSYTEKESEYTEENKITKLSDTEIKELIQEDWNKYNKNRYKVSISKIEKSEEDGKGRYIYVIYWSEVSQAIESEGWSPYSLTTDADITGKIEQVSVYGIDATNTPDNPNILSSTTSSKNEYEVIQMMKQKEELNWGK